MLDIIHRTATIETVPRRVVAVEKSAPRYTLHGYLDQQPEAARATDRLRNSIETMATLALYYAKVIEIERGHRDLGAWSEEFGELRHHAIKLMTVWNDFVRTTGKAGA